ncbi:MULTISPECIES: phage tail sheath subtilisin-like domain-containing protein [Pseudoalteromonas]|uniref:Phage tail sheath protein FI n=1 Tax=Pseudoalteromonas luteoviolacea (strain 2ta16) TaxID=1353533 RepID=V4I5D8_PSEL2|nr:MULTISPECIES: phage tail sheath subtilisin-like domain-containing protein [Pseudoalteromonas]ESP95454.1 phage tail sheath protein FI [Pseudoalteromonas luteoviolacea 2ta16]KZN31023.1 tail protein [Pseudoalteromonas luteoviolacea NCIMB 1944]MBQ4836282.1 phage tail sheath subtilisin-like domain-containing protein [Pseudoalteromonas luteoviolacea]MCG7548429.1 phage tail sheath subtilisin-like domain-containing protein [Pseudoalteromonas sp. Of7M-16]
MSQFLHGVEVIEAQSGTRPIKTVKSSVIGLIGTAPQADAEKFPLNTPVLIAGKRAEAALLGEQGTLPAAIDGVFDQAGAVVVVVRVDGADESAVMTNIQGGVAADGSYEGAYAFLGAESVLGVTPRILVAPGFTHQRPSGAANPVVAELVGIAERLRAVIIADGPNTNDADAIAYRGDCSSRRVYVVDPQVKVFKEGAVVNEPASARVAGMIAKSDNDRGFWWSPSNTAMNGIVGTARPVDFQLGDKNARANLLNEKEVSTIIRQNGFKLWGNRTCATDPKWAFLSVVRTADMINDSLLRAHMWAVDRNITSTYIKDVTESVQAYLDSLKAQGAILGGQIWADEDLNTPENIQAGKVYFSFDFTPPTPAEHITFKSILTNNYLEEIV